VINIPMKSTATLRASSFMTQGYQTRRMAVDHSVPLITNSKNVKLLVQSLKACLCARPPVKTFIDCVNSKPCIKLPGLIDVHVHLREPGGCHKEDILSGTSAALAGGYTMVLAMPNTNPALTDESSLSAIEKIYTEKAVCDYGLYAGATGTNAEAISTLASRTCGLKMYLNETFNALKMDKIEYWMQHFIHWPKSTPICCHAEEQSLAAILYLAQLYERHVHICHVSSKEDIYLIRKAKEKGIQVTCEVAPHHLFLSEEDYANFGADVLQVRPKLKSPEDRKALWDALDIIDMFASDHAPHTYEEKTSDAVPGFPGLETSLALMLTAYKQGKISLETIIEKSCINPRKIFKLPEQEDTFIEVDLDSEWTIPSAMPFSKCKWTPFAGMKVFGAVRRVTLRGEVVYVDGKVLAAPGSGRNIVRLSEPKKLSLQIPESISKQSISEAVSPRRVPAVPSVENSLRRLSDAKITDEAIKAGSVIAPIALTSAALSSRQSLTPKNASIVPIMTSLNFYKCNIVSVENFTKDHLHNLFNLAHDYRTYVSNDKDLTDVLKGRVMAQMFFEPSTRTQCSFAAAMYRLGGSVINMDSNQSSMKKGETLDDSIRMMSSYGDCIVIRHPEHGAAELATKFSRIPVINAGDGTGEHPTQALLDIFTIREEIGTVNGITITMVGDLKHGRTVHSLAKLLALYKVTLKYVSPEFLRMPKSIIERLSKHNIVQEEYTRIEEALEDTDVLYMTRIQKERFENVSEYEKVAGMYVVTPQLMSKAKKKMIVMHPLPRVDEISTAVDSDPRAAYFRQAEYGMFVRMALLTMILKQS